MARALIPILQVPPLVLLALKAPTSLAQDFRPVLRAVLATFRRPLVLLQQHVLRVLQVPPPRVLVLLLQVRVPTVVQGATLQASLQ